MALTDYKIKAAKPKDKNYKLADGNGLHLMVYKTGKKVWRQKYHFAKKEKLLTIGPYPEITLKQARDKCLEARKKLYDGIDPCEHKKLNKFRSVNDEKALFQHIANEWFLKSKPTWSISYSSRVHNLLERDIYPYLGKIRPVDINAPMILAVLRKIEARGAIETAHRAKNIIGQAMRYAIATGRADRDYTPDLKGALKKPIETHLAAIIEPKKVGQLLYMIDGYEGTAIIRNALQFAAYVFVRPGELRQAEWTEINFEAQRFEIPAHKMKMRQPHIVPLSKQALAILKDQQAKTGHFQFVFPSPRSPRRAMSNNALLSALRRMGIEKNEMTVHGFRAMARTLLDEELNYRIEWIEYQLAHSVRDSNGRAYNRTSYIKDRTEMMQAWADYLDKLKNEAKNKHIIQNTI